NQHPAPMLKKLAGDPKGSARDAQRSRLPFDVDEFIQSNYNFQGKLGTIFRRDPKYEVHFDKYERIADAYKQAFDFPIAALDTDVDRSLFDLAQTRNVIVHRAGVADKHFVARMVEIKSPLPQLATLKMGDRIPIDGSLTRTIIDGSISAS